jgi:hypothetical protein
VLVQTRRTAAAGTVHCAAQVCACLWQVLLTGPGCCGLLRACTHVRRAAVCCARAVMLKGFHASTAQHGTARRSTAHGLKGTHLGGECHGLPLQHTLALCHHQFRLLWQVGALQAVAVLTVDA